MASEGKSKHAYYPNQSKSLKLCMAAAFALICSAVSIGIGFVLNINVFAGIFIFPKLSLFGLALTISNLVLFCLALFLILVALACKTFKQGINTNSPVLPYRGLANISRSGISCVLNTIRPTNGRKSGLS